MIENPVHYPESRVVYCVELPVILTAHLLISSISWSFYLLPPLFGSYYRVEKHPLPTAFNIYPEHVSW